MSHVLCVKYFSNVLILATSLIRNLDLFWLTSNIFMYITTQKEIHVFLKIYISLCGIGNILFVLQKRKKCLKIFFLLLFQIWLKQLKHLNKKHNIKLNNHNLYNNTAHSNNIHVKWILIVQSNLTTYAK